MLCTGCGRLGYDSVATNDGGVTDDGGVGVSFILNFSASNSITVSGLGVDANGNIYVVGKHDGDLSLPGASHAPVGRTNMFIASYDSSGVYRWSHSYGGAQFVDARDVAVAANGTSYSSGLVIQQADFQGVMVDGGNTQDVLLAIHDTAGDIVSVNLFQSINDNAQGRGIGINSNEDIAISGLYGGDVDFGGGFLGPAENERGFSVVFNAGVSLSWARPYAGSGQIFGNDAAIADDGTSCFTGKFDVTTDFGGGPVTPLANDAYLVNYAPSSAFRWAAKVTSAFGDFGEGVAAMPDGGCLLVGRSGGDVDFGTGEVAGLGGTDAFIARYDGIGDLDWKHLLGGVGADEGRALGVDAAGLVYVAGSFEGTADFAGFSLTSDGGTDGFVLALDEFGTAMWASQIRSTGDLNVRAIAIDESAGAVVVAGHDPGGGYIFRFVPE